MLPPVFIVWRSYDMYKSVHSCCIHWIKVRYVSHYYHVCLHWITASSIAWFCEPLSILQLSNQGCWVDARIGCLGCTEDLPAGHSKWPLCKKVSCKRRNLWVCTTLKETEIVIHGLCTTHGLFSCKASTTKRYPMHLSTDDLMHT